MNELTQTTPEYAIQPNAISQAIYDCGTNSKKLISMAVSLLPMNLKSKEDYSVSFTISDFLTALGITDGSRTRELTRKAIKECAKTVLTVNDDDDCYELIPWFYKSKVKQNTDIIEMTFNPQLAQLILELKGKAKLNLIDIGKLQSKYAIRFYEIAMSYAGFAGKNGNKENCWYFEREIGELRELFCISDNKYKMTKDFRVRIIDEPIQELNACDVGFKIEVEYLRKGKKLTGFRFCCQYESKTERVATPTAETLREKEIEHLKRKYPEEWEKFYQEELSGTQPLFGKELWNLTCQAKAYEKLRKMKGIQL